MALTKSAVKRLRNNFLDESVVIYLRDMNVIAVNEAGGEMKVAAMTEGFCVDIDEDYFYLGTPDGAITRVIGHDVAQMVELAFNPDEIAITMEMPGVDEDVH